MEYLEQMSTDKLAIITISLIILVAIIAIYAKQMIIYGLRKEIVDYEVEFDDLRNHIKIAQSNIVDRDNHIKSLRDAIRRLEAKAEETELNHSRELRTLRASIIPAKPQINEIKKAPTRSRPKKEKE